jgi:uroporphyrinogen-III synthase
VSFTVIVTRTLPGADDTARDLSRLGYRPIISPMLTLSGTAPGAEALTGIRHVIFTSANGVRALGEAAGGDVVTAWCVGPSTAAAASEAGFADVRSADGHAGDLAALILAARPEGPLLHIANEAAAGQLVAALTSGGLDARFLSPYRTEAAASLTPEAIAALSGTAPVIILLHSAKAAEALAASRPSLDRAAGVAISAAALAPLKDQFGRGSRIAIRPNEASLQDALRESAAALQG